MLNQEILFDRKILRQNRKRTSNQFSKHSFLHNEIANNIVQNIEFLNQKFELVLELSARNNYLSNLIKEKNLAKEIITTSFGDKNIGQIIIDDEFLPFKEQSFDLILTNLNFHYINQIPQFLLEIYKILKPKGLFMASFFGEENLSQLAHILYKTENEIYGGISPRMPPTIDVKTAANLLQKAGFKNPISDFEEFEVEYSNPINLLKDLKIMGQGNILTKRSRRFMTKSFLNKINKNYLENYPNGVATFEVITVTGWK